MSRLSDLFTFRPLFEGDGDGGGGGEGAGTSGEGEGEGEGEGAGSGTGAGEDDGNETVTLTKAELNRLNAAVANSNKRAKELDDAEKKRQREADEEAGEHKKIADDAIANVTKLEGALKKTAITGTVSSIAGELGFKSPSLAARVIEITGVDAELDDDGNATVDDAGKVELKKRLENALKAHPELGEPVKQRRQVRGGGTDDTDAGASSAKSAFGQQIREQLGR